MSLFQGVLLVERMVTRTGRALGSLLGLDQLIGITGTDNETETAQNIDHDHDNVPWMRERMEEGVRVDRKRPRRLVVLLHGLEGSSTAPLTKRFSSVYAESG